MGRGRGGGRGNFRGKGRHRGNRDNRDSERTTSWSEIERKNHLFENYYKNGGFLDEGEFEDMWKHLASELPNSFRFTGTKGEAVAVREIFKKRYIPGIAAAQFEGESVQPPQPVQAFPDELVWDMKTHRKAIRRFKPFADFQKFLVAETSSGNISRQEVVSMIPPHFLDVKPGMVVLDMCAAPGSKSAQLAEMIHGDEEERVKKAASNESFDATSDGDYTDDGRSTGLLIANDTDYKRAGMLVHQVKRLNFPNLIVTQHDASIFPSIELPPATGSTRPQYLKFDRILCDVPCSGDGTARKNPNVWQKWTPRDGLGLHNLQLRILCRGLQLLKKGGRLVYSTCSMNPVENEAVVASAIEACGGIKKVQLVDCSDHLPNLIRKPGLNTWKVLDTSTVGGGDKENHMFTSWDTFLKTLKKYEVEDPGRKFSNKIIPGVFPPTATTDDARIALERCLRVYPHLQNTGGFFIAVLEKLDDIKAGAPGNLSTEDVLQKSKNASQGHSTPVEGTNGSTPGNSKRLKRKSEELDEEATATKRTKTESNGTDDNVTMTDIPQEANSELSATGADTDAQVSQELNDTLAAESKPPVKLKPENQSQKEYFEYLSPTDSTIAKILDFFGISERFPRDRFLVRNKEGLLLNKIYYTSELARTIIEANKTRGFRFIHCGVVMFVSHKVKDKDGDNTSVSTWRLQNEGIKILEPWASKRIVECDSRDTLYKMLIEIFPKLPKDGDHGLGEVGNQLEALDVGCCFMRIGKREAEDGDEGFPFPMVLPVWRHPGSINLMVDKDDRKANLLRLYNVKDPDLINFVLDKAKRDAKAEREEENDRESEVMNTAD
ncbi:S-adenosyl-L-methionine-dependent methyltransferase [Lophiostoma macrostomum CBS 122681]|uniref:S-adenosyl-L-methionine-dependent methyltransferase n=1 Tax=Lophiostoma macrostomum CBS 122681 TaxID=1314788 RepID=A0A6A6TL54_9PLEO|nr:S-adenosyl-L-methionine-dependent methyltransferase [Lophiostoma macrostomum CBS 122681]